MTVKKENRFWETRWPESRKVTRSCINCDKEFLSTRSYVEGGRANYCSKRCRASYFWAKRGIEIGYRAKHQRIERRLGKACTCFNCHQPNTRFHWSNISGKYLDIISDWIQLCPKCHRAFDLGRLNIDLSNAGRGADSYQI